MRKICFLLALVCSLPAMAQTMDTVRFTITYSANRFVNFTNTSVLSDTAGKKAIWFFGDGTSALKTHALGGAVHQYNPGTYQACLRIYRFTAANDTVLVGQECKQVTIHGAPDSCRAEFETGSVSNSTLVKHFLAKPFHNNGKKPERICWTFGDGTDTCIYYNPAVSNNYVVTHAYKQTGNYNVCVKIKYAGGCEASLCRNISTVFTPAADSCRGEFTVDGTTTISAARKFTAFPWHNKAKKPVKICWQFGDGKDTCINYPATFTGPYSVTHTYAQPGNYNVCMRIVYEGGCEKTNCRTIGIAVPPPADTCHAGILELIHNSSNVIRHLSAVPMAGRRPEKICWTFGDGRDTCVNLPNPFPPSALTISHAYPGPGVYRACVKVWYAGGCVTQSCRNVEIRSTAKVCGGYMVDSLSGAKTINFKGFGIVAGNDQVISYHWSFGDGTSATGQAVSHSYSSAGLYEVCLVMETREGCRTRICKKVSVAGSVQPNLVLTPNPVTSVLHAVFQSTKQETVTVSIYNATGLLMTSTTRNAVMGTNTWDFNVGTLPAGVYSVIVRSQSQIANAMFFKQ
jgi:PKD repeat protein